MRVYLKAMDGIRAKVLGDTVVADIRYEAAQVALGRLLQSVIKPGRARVCD
jgi:hypothetical protein